MVDDGQVLGLALRWAMATTTRATRSQPSSQVDQRCDERKAKHASVPFRHVCTLELRCKKFLYELKAGPAGGRLRRPPSRRQTTCHHRAMSERHSSLSFERIADRYDATRGGEQRGRRTAASLAPLLEPAFPVVEVASAPASSRSACANSASRSSGLISHQPWPNGRDAGSVQSSRLPTRLNCPSPTPRSSRPYRSGCCTWWPIGRRSWRRWPALCGPVADIW
jgi:hypothetical protein